jgi:hypothetical protein
MSGHELMEHLEHGAHGGHGADHHKPDAAIGKAIGMTMATLGVLLALCSALVGGARTELIATMVEQTNSSLEYQSVATKYRMLQAQLQQLHALMPDPKEFAAAEKELKTIEEQAASGAGSEVLRALHLQAGKILNTVTPTRGDVLRFAHLVRGFDGEREAAKAWSESYDQAIAAHAHAAEHFEWAQLATEIGIVLASIALLLGSRRARLGALTLGAIGVAIAVSTFSITRMHMHHAEAKIADARQHYQQLTDERAEAAEDAKLLADIERE